MLRKKNVATWFGLVVGWVDKTCTCLLTAVKQIFLVLTPVFYQDVADYGDPCHWGWLDFLEKGFLLNWEKLLARPG